MGRNTGADMISQHIVIPQAVLCSLHEEDCKENNTKGNACCIIVAYV